MTTPYFDALNAYLRSHANSELAGPMQAYMRDQFQYLGIKSPQRKELMKTFIQQHGVPSTDELEDVVWALWELPEREYQYVAMLLLDKQRRKLPVEFAEFFEKLTVTKSWWDTIDWLASHAVGDLFQRFPESRDQYITRWRYSDDFWLRRITLLFQLGYKDKTDVELLFSLIEENMDSTEFFIRKAIGWALREYSKRDADRVIGFVADHPDLSPLSQREALKWLKNKGMIS